MTKTEACRRVALAALLAGSMAAAQDASAGTMNGISLNGFADRSNALPDGGSPDGAEIAAGTAKPDPTGNPKRGSNSKRASNPDGIMAFFDGCPDPKNC